MVDYFWNQHLKFMNRVQKDPLKIMFYIQYVIIHALFHLRGRALKLQFRLI